MTRGYSVPPFESEPTTMAARCDRVTRMDHPEATEHDDGADEQRTELIISTLVKAFEPLMQSPTRTASGSSSARWHATPSPSTAAPPASSTPTSGPAARSPTFDERWVDDDTSRVWIQGDLHAENFGTYLDAEGRLVFDVNDFDEAYLGHWTLGPGPVLRPALHCCAGRRPCPTTSSTTSSLRYVRAYADQVEHYRERRRRHATGRSLSTPPRVRSFDALPGRQARHPRRPARLGHRRRRLPPSLHRRARGCAASTDDERAGGQGRPSPRYLDTIPDDPREARSRSTCSTWWAAPASASAAPACRPTTSSSRDSRRRWTTTSCSPCKQGNVAAPSRVVARRARRAEPLRAPRPPHRHLTAGPAGAGRPLPRVDGAAGLGRPRRRLRRERGIAV